ncbi:MAG: hypothetical protein M1429_00215 [Patescibacteria group bacterium]|nr:hypothetical protein [Patescibacteria group bacterium]
MPLKFSYKKFPSDPNEAFPNHKSAQRPVIPITIKYKDKKIDYLTLIDSGADFCIFHSEIGEYLGIDIKSGRKLEFFGVTGDKKISYFHNVTLNIGGNNKECYCGFAPDFTAHRMPYGILGQKGFFDMFKVMMDYNKNRIELS